MQPPPSRPAELRPEYYDPQSAYEPWKIIDHYDLSFYTGNALKYLLRAGRKTDNIREDLQKAVTYLSKAIRDLEPEPKEQPEELEPVKYPAWPLDRHWCNDRFSHVPHWHADGRACPGRAFDQT